MTKVWSHRPPVLHLAIFVAAYVLGCAFAASLAIVPGITVSIWPPGGVFMATLILTSPYSWPWWIVGGCLGEMIGQLVWFHSGIAVGSLIYVGNALAAVIGASLVRWFCGRPVRLETLREVLAFVVLGAVVAPLASATVGSATLAYFGVKSQAFTQVWPLFYIGDATGILLVAPLALVVLQNWHSKTRLSAAQWVEAGVLGLVFLGVAALSLSNYYLPFAYIIMPPLLWAAVRFEFKGVAVALSLLALLTAALTISGASQFVGDPESQRQKQIMLQLFLVISAFSALIVAAISRQHQQALLTVRESERQLQQLIDTVPAAIARRSPDGELTFFNKRMVDFLGLGVSDTDRPRATRMDVVIQTLVHPDDAGGVRETLDRAFATGEGYAYRYRLRRADGVYRWMEARGEPLRDYGGAIVQWYSVSIDVEDEVRAQAALRDRERELSQLVNMVPVHIRRMTPQGEPTFFNKRLIDFFGLGNLADLDKPGMSRLTSLIQALVHPDDSARLLETSRRCFAAGEPFSMKYRMQRADGAYRWVDTRAEPLRDQRGAIVNWYVVSIEIDEEVRAQQALRDRERELAQIVDMVPSLLWRLNTDGEPTFFNKRTIDFLGSDVADYDQLGTSRLEAVIETGIHPDEAAAFRDNLNHCLATGEPLSMKYRLRRADGVYRWMSGRAEPMRDDSGRVVQWFGLCHDIDDQMRFYSELEEREAKIRRLVDSDIIGIVIWDLDGRLIDANDAFLRIVQYEREDLQAGLRWIDMTPPEWQDVHAREEAEELAATGMMQGREKEYFRKDGSRVPVLIGAACFEGQSRQGVAYILDLTERKRAEAALRDRERELAQLVDMLPVFIRRMTPEGEPVFFNKRLTDYIGVSLAEIGAAGTSRLAPAIENFVHPDEAAKVVAAIRDAVVTGEAYAMRYRMRGADGVYRWLETRAEPLRNQDGTIAQWYSVSIDIEDEMRAQHAEEALRRASDKLAQATQAASLAELSASIAHEVNQPLAAIVANSHACYRWLSAEPPNVVRAKITAERITRDANSAADVVSRIRALFRQSVEPRNSVALTSVVSEARDLMAEEAARRRIRFNVDIESNLPLIAFDRVQVQQVLINLIRNGMDAMDSTASDKALGIRVRRAGDVVRTEITDHGRGVEFPDRIFDPFYTTKENGMGMGLAICRSIVESHRGRLWVEKNEPQGATFIFTLPVDVTMGHVNG